MNIALGIALAVTLVAITVVLLMGVASMGQGGDFNRKYANKLMRLRVILQGVAVLIIVLMFFAN